jgi:hypothetical protein
MCARSPLHSEPEMRRERFSSWIVPRPGAAAGTLSPRSEVILDHYLAELGVELHEATPIFWSRGGHPRSKGRATVDTAALHEGSVG